MKVTWRDVLGFEGLYEVSSDGRVRSLHRKVPQDMSLFLEHTGYQAVVLKGAGRPRRFRVHRLVLLAFSRPPKAGEQARHLNDNKQDNRIENLKWGTAKENKEDARRNGRIAQADTHGQRKLTSKDVLSIRERVASGESRYELAKEFGVGYQQIGNIVRKDSWSSV